MCACVLINNRFHSIVDVIVSYVRIEMCEGLDCSLDGFVIQETDHVMSQMSHKAQLCLHF